MARKFTAGAEFNANTTTQTTDIDYDSLVSSTSITYDTTTVRSGTYSWKFTNTSTASNLQRQYSSGSNDSYVCAYINVSVVTTASGISILLIRDGTNGNNANIRLTKVSASTFTLALWNEQAGAQLGSNSATLNTNTWYRVEFGYINSTGVITAYIDGVQFATGTGTASLGSNILKWGNIDTATMTIFFDDIAVNDNTAGGTQTGLVGDHKVIRLKPNAAGDVNTFATQTGGTAGSGNNFTRVNEVRLDDATSFNGASVVNQEDLFNCDDSGIQSYDTVNVVEVWGRYRNITADATTAIKFEIEKTGSGTIQQSSAITPNSTTWKMNAGAAPKTPPLVTYTDPDGANWTQSTLDSMQIGYKLTLLGVNTIDVTNVSAIVDYTPGTPPPPSTGVALRMLRGIGS